MVLGQRLLNAGLSKEAVASFDKALMLGKAQKLNEQVLDALLDMRKKAAEQANQ